MLESAPLGFISLLCCFMLMFCMPNGPYHQSSFRPPRGRFMPYNTASHIVLGRSHTQQTLLLLLSLLYAAEQPVGLLWATLFSRKGPMLVALQMCLVCVLATSGTGFESSLQGYRTLVAVSRNLCRWCGITQRSQAKGDLVFVSKSK